MQTSWAIQTVRLSSSQYKKYLKLYCCIFSANKTGEKKKKKLVQDCLLCCLLPNRRLFYSFTQLSVAPSHLLNQDEIFRSKVRSSSAWKTTIWGLLLSLAARFCFLWSILLAMKCMLLLLSIPCVLLCPAAPGSHVLSLAVAAQKHLLILVAASLHAFPHGKHICLSGVAAPAPAKLKNNSQREFEGKYLSTSKAVHLCETCPSEDLHSCPYHPQAKFLAGTATSCPAAWTFHEGQALD